MMILPTHAGIIIKALSSILAVMILSACLGKHPYPAALRAPSTITGEDYYRRAMEYAQDSNYWSKPFEAFHLFRKAAELGHVAAQDRTGWGYQFALGTERDLYKAAEWYRRAAEAGNPKAQTSLGLFLYYGLGGKKDRAEALSWTRKAAEQRYPAGINNMGAIYEQGKAVPRDYGLAVHYYRQAADRGYSLAKSNLGVLYLEGKGLTKDAEKAYRLFRESCTEKNRWGFAGCYHLLKNSQDIGADDELYARALSALEVACWEERGRACEYAGLIYLNGWGVDRDGEKAVEYFQQGCSMGMASACGMAGDLYYFGDGVDEDKDLAEILLAEACNNDDEESCEKLTRIKGGDFSRKVPEDSRIKK